MAKIVNKDHVKKLLRIVTTKTPPKKQLRNVTTNNHCNKSPHNDKFIPLTLAKKIIILNTI
jgi:hypothetical protein